MLAVGMQKAEVARTPESLGQHMLQHQPEELRAGKRSALQLSGTGVAITEADFAVGAGEDVFLGDDAPVQIAPQVDERLLARADGFAIHHPRRGVTIGQPQPGGLDGREQLRPEHLGQRLVVEQIAALCLAPPTGSPLLLLAIDRRCRHDQMDMRVIVQFARVGVQDGDGAGRALQLLVVLTEGLHCFPGAAHEHIIDGLLVRKGKPSEFGREREGQQKVLGRHLLLQLAFQPLLALVVLAVLAVAMAAGMRHPFLMRASCALDVHHGAGFCAALFHRRECPSVLGSEPVPILRQEVGLEAVDDGGQADHLTRPQAMPKPSIRRLIRSRA